MNLPKQIILATALFGGMFASVPALAATGLFTGLYATNFDAIGVAGTAMPLGFRTMTLAGANTTYSAATPISAAGIASATASGTQTLIVWNASARPAAPRSTGCSRQNKWH